MLKKLFPLIVFLPLTANSAPDWFENPVNEPGYIVGLGLGDNLTQAKKDAISDIANSLYSNVNSSVSITASTSLDGGEYNTNLDQSIESKNILLPKITWKKMAAEDGIYYTVAQVSQRETVELYEKTLSMELKPFESILKNSRLSLNEYLYIQGNKTLLTIASERARAINSFSPLASQYHKQIESIFDKRNQFANTTCFSVKKSHSKLADKFYLPAIESAIQSDKFILNNQNQCIPVKFRANTNKSGKTIANVSMQLTIGEPAVVSKVIHFKGQSSGSYKSAMIDAADNFSTHFDKNGGLLYSMMNKPGNSINIEL